jgi:hypothetical protein
LNFTFTFAFQLLLRRSTRTNDLPDIVHRRIVRIRYEYFSLFLRRLVVWRRFISWVHGKDFVNQSNSLFIIAVF